MSTPSTILYVHPGWASARAWSYAGTSLASSSATAAAAVTAVAFDVDASHGQSLSRGTIQYSLNGGQSWLNYAAPTNGQGAFVSVSGTTWRFLDSSGGDDTTSNTFSAHYGLADGSTVEVDTAVVADDSPVGLVGAAANVLSTAHAGDTVDVLSPIDTGQPNGGRWVIDGQSQGGLFGISYNPATDATAKLVIANAAALPASGMAASVTVHYYDAYQLDSNGNPIAGQGVSSTLSYTVQDGATSDLAGLSTEARMGTATDAQHAAPALATLSTGGYVAAWQGPDTVAGGAGAGLWAQLRDASGNAAGAAFALTPNGDAKLEGAPSVTALADGRFAVAYSELDGGVNKIAYRIVEANGTAGAEHVLDSGGTGDAAMPSLATLADGSFAVAWRSGGAVEVQDVRAADGTLVGAAQSFAQLGSAFSPAITALKGGGYALAWGEINDGNVYLVTSANPTAIVVNGDGDAASISTAAPLPHVTTLANGGVVVAWDSYANDPTGFNVSDIYFQTFDATGHATGAVTQANVDSGGGRFDAAVGALSDGSFVVTWQGGDFDANGIFGRRFGADGSALDTHEFEINGLRAGDQTSPAVTALAGGGFAGAWVDSGSAGVGVETRVLVPHDAGGGTQGSGAQGSGAQGSGAQASVAANSTAMAAAGTATPAAAPVATPVAAPVATPTGTGGADIIKAPAGTATVDGGAGLDTVAYAGASTGYTIQKDSADGGFSVANASGDRATLLNVERVQFADQMVALDIGGNAGEAYRLYQAAFHRTPDKVGLGYWIAALDGGQALQSVAGGFVNSAEFASLYGATSTDAQFVDALYANVLHRTADGSGYDFWMHAIGSASRADVLVDFSESAENQAQVIGTIGNGIAYQHWG